MAYIATEDTVGISRELAPIRHLSAQDIRLDGHRILAKSPN